MRYAISIKDLWGRRSFQILDSAQDLRVVSRSDTWDDAQTICAALNIHHRTQTKKLDPGAS